MTITVLAPPTPYDRTSRRPAWESLPPAFRSSLTDLLGSAVVSAQVSGTGFTTGFAALLTLASGDQAFIKATELSHYSAPWYRREAEITSALPSRVRTARLRWIEEVYGFVVACYDAIEGARVPELPWRPADLAATLDTLAVTYAELSSPPPALLALKLEPWGSVIDGTLDKWRTTSLEHPQRAEFVRLEAQFDELTRHDTQLVHGDLRLDNVVIDSAGGAWLCDWNCLCYGPAWFDTVSLLLSAEASGIDPDPLFWSHPTAAGVSPAALDSALAALLGYYLYSSAQPDIPESPNIRPHQRYYAALTTRWLTRRLPLPPPPPAPPPDDLTVALTS